MIRQFNTSASTGIPSAGTWLSLKTLEPAAAGTKRLVTIEGSTRSSVALAERFSDKWDVVGADTASIAYIGNNPIPAPIYNPFRNHVYVAPAGAAMRSQNNSTATSYALRMTSFPFANLTWTRVRIWMADINGTPVAPTGIWVALTDGGDVTAPTVGGTDSTWVAATGLVAPPSGTDVSPGVGPVCSYVTLSGNSANIGIAVRVQLPSGDFTGAGIGTNPIDILDGWNNPKSQGSISSTPGTTSGWGEVFGQFPFIFIEFEGLSAQQCLLGCIGDSHIQGYTGTGMAGYRGVFGDTQLNAGYVKKICTVNLGRSGHNQAQIATRLRAFETQMDFGGWLRERASVNDHDANFDVSVATSDVSWSVLQSDYVYILGRGKLLIPFQGAGANGWAAGWYGRFNTHIADEQAAYPWGIYASSSILNSDGSYKSGLYGADGGHPNEDGYTQWSATVWPALQSSLTTLGVTL